MNLSASIVKVRESSQRQLVRKRMKLEGYQELFEHGIEPGEHGVSHAHDLYKDPADERMGSEHEVRKYELPGGDKYIVPLKLLGKNQAEVDRLRDKRVLGRKILTARQVYVIAKRKYERVLNNEDMVKLSKLKLGIVNRIKYYLSSKGWISRNFAREYRGRIIEIKEGIRDAGFDNSMLAPDVRRMLGDFKLFSSAMITSLKEELMRLNEKYIYYQHVINKPVQYLNVRRAINQRTGKISVREIKKQLSERAYPNLIRNSRWIKKLLNDDSVDTSNKFLFVREGRFDVFTLDPEDEKSVEELQIRFDEAFELSETLKEAQHAGSSNLFKSNWFVDKMVNEAEKLQYQKRRTRSFSYAKRNLGSGRALTRSQLMRAARRSGFEYKKQVVKGLAIKIRKGDFGQEYVKLDVNLLKELIAVALILDKKMMKDLKSLNAISFEKQCDFFDKTVKFVLNSKAVLRGTASFDTVLKEYFKSGHFKGLYKKSCQKPVKEEEWKEQLQADFSKHWKLSTGFRKVGISRVSKKRVRQNVVKRVDDFCKRRLPQGDVAEFKRILLGGDDLYSQFNLMRSRLAMIVLGPKYRSGEYVLDERQIITLYNQWKVFGFCGKLVEHSSPAFLPFIFKLDGKPASFAKEVLNGERLITESEFKEIATNKNILSTFIRMFEANIKKKLPEDFKQMLLDPNLHPSNDLETRVAALGQIDFKNTDKKVAQIEMEMHGLYKSWKTRFPGPPS